MDLGCLSQLFVMLLMGHFPGLQFLLGNRLPVVIILGILNDLSQWKVSIRVLDGDGDGGRVRLDKGVLGGGCVWGDHWGEMS